MCKLYVDFNGEKLFSFFQKARKKNEKHFWLLFFIHINMIIIWMKIFHIRNYFQSVLHSLTEIRKLKSRCCIFATKIAWPILVNRLFFVHSTFIFIYFIILFLFFLMWTNQWWNFHATNRCRRRHHHDIHGDKKFIFIHFKWKNPNAIIVHTLAHVFKKKKFKPMTQCYSLNFKLLFLWCYLFSLIYKMRQLNTTYSAYNVFWLTSTKKN